MKNNKTALHNSIMLTLFNIIFFASGKLPKQIICTNVFFQKDYFAFLINLILYTVYLWYICAFVGKNKSLFRKDLFSEYETLKEKLCVNRVIAILTLQVVTDAVYIILIPIMRPFYNHIFIIIHWIIIYIVLTYKRDTFMITKSKISKAGVFKSVLIVVVISVLFVSDFYISRIEYDILKKQFSNMIFSQGMTSLLLYFSTPHPSVLKIINAVHSLIAFSMDTVIGIAVIHHYSSLSHGSYFKKHTGIYAE